MLKEYFRANPRVAGVVLTVISLIMGKFFIWDVAAAAQAHAEQVSVSMKAVTFSVAFFLTGMFLFVTGPVGGALLQKAPGQRTLSLMGWILVAVIVAVTFGVYFAFKSYIESFGYQF